MFWGLANAESNALLGHDDVAEERIHPVERRRFEHTTDGERVALARGSQERDGAADREVVLVGKPLLQDHAVRTEVGEQRVVALLPLEPCRLADRGVDPVHGCRCAGDSCLLLPDVRHDSYAGHRSDQVAGLGLEDVEAVLGCDHEVGVELRRDRGLVRVPHARPQRRHDRDQREADHERGGSGSRAGRVPDSVLAGQPACLAASMSRRLSDNLHQRPDETRRDQPDAEKHRDASDRDQQEHRTRLSASTPRAVPNATAPAAINPSATNGATGAKRDRGKIEPSRTAAIGGTRVARSAGPTVATTVMPTPTSSETTTVRVWKTVPVCGKSSWRTPSSQVETLREPHAQQQPDERSDEPDHDSLQQHRAQNLAP